jgi:hypothetical protein
LARAGINPIRSSRRALHETKNSIQSTKIMKNTSKFMRAFLTGTLGLILTFSAFTVAPRAFASGGGGVKVLNFSGNWTGTITAPFGIGAFLMKISQSTGALSGSAHFGAPIFDSALKLAGATLDGINFSGFVSNGEGSLPITGTLSVDGSTITGTVIQLGQTYTYIVFRN